MSDFSITELRVTAMALVFAELFTERFFGSAVARSVAIPSFARVRWFASLIVWRVLQPDLGHHESHAVGCGRRRGGSTCFGRRLFRPCEPDVVEVKMADLSLIREVLEEATFIGDLYRGIGSGVAAGLILALFFGIRSWISVLRDRREQIRYLRYLVLKYRG